MKRTLLSTVLLGLLIFPIVGQVDHDHNLNDRVPVVNASISKDQVPAEVLKSVTRQFNKNDVLTWSRFPYALKEYGWVYDVGASDIPLDRFEVTMKTKEGTELWAVYSSKGELIETREMSLNIPVPTDIQKKIANSQYKDWTIVGNKEIIKYYHDHDEARVEQHFRVTLEKDNVTRSVSFNYNSKKDK